MKTSKMWRTLEVLRENPDGVTSEHLVSAHMDLYHHWSQRCSDLKKLNYIIVCEKTIGPDWAYKWTLMNPRHRHVEEYEAFPEVRPYVDRSGQAHLSI